MLDTVNYSSRKQPCKIVQEYERKRLRDSPERRLNSRRSSRGSNLDCDKPDMIPYPRGFFQHPSLLREVGGREVFQRCRWFLLLLPSRPPFQNLCVVWLFVCFHSFSQKGTWQETPVFCFVFSWLEIWAAPETQPRSPCEAEQLRSLQSCSPWCCLFSVCICLVAEKITSICQNCSSVSFLWGSGKFK